ncbi:DEAD/DEAH box helicase [Fibrobacter sp.]|uniref:DEAD/DEAH box helicase n=1 Tax=Fibrobacter sp. TaxID=35828 RepID=UPI003890A834
MILKPYQKQIIDDLALFLEKLRECRNIAEAFNAFWMLHPRTPITPSFGEAVEPYKNNVPNCPHVCIKVPTAGGKTFIAANALSAIFKELDPARPKIAVWLVPSNSILEQTIRNFSNPRHPYREQLNIDFANKVNVFDKRMLLQGAGFNTSSVRENMTLCILSFDSLRARKKEDRKVNEENGNLQSFAKDVDEEEISVMSVLRAFNPVVVVDESHNAESELSVEMLKNLNPSFILDLTATPRKNSNIISFTPAIELKKENMVKLPVIVYNHHKKEEVVSSALELRSKLEHAAVEAEKSGAPYIRPIVLFQAEPKTKDDNATFERVKSMLLELKIPEEQIKIKTADKNELQNVNLLSKDCPVRYIITVNALKEGWDCPFAYILASLADRSSSVDVEQILGRVLRLPNVRKNENVMLNMSYVFTASARFSETLDGIVKGLNRAGFSSNDYRQVEIEKSVEPTETPAMESVGSASSRNGDDEIAQDDAFDLSSIFWNGGEAQQEKETPAKAGMTNTEVKDILAQIEQLAKKENEELEKCVEENKTTPVPPPEMENQVKTFAIKDTFKESANQILLPQFFMKGSIEGMHVDLFNIKATPFDKDMLLKNFPLRNADTNIDFDTIEIDMRSIDLDESQKDFTPTIFKVSDYHQQEIIHWLSNIDDEEKKRQKCAERLRDWIGDMYPIPDPDIVEYIRRILSNFNENDLEQMLRSQSSYAEKIKQKINTLAAEYIEREFDRALDADKIIIQANYKITDKIALSSIGKPLPKTLHEKEESVNGFEENVINAVANMENVEFWTRNREKKDFCINGFIKHYPDFIIKTKLGKIVLLETKGDHLDAEKKIKLGNLWASKAGNNYRYCLVYEHRRVEHAYTKDEFLAALKEW